MDEITTLEQLDASLSDFQTTFLLERRGKAVREALELAIRRRVQLTPKQIEAAVSDAKSTVIALQVLQFRARLQQLERDQKKRS